jgi:type II secretory pathway pseudopilin PulG
MTCNTSSSLFGRTSAGRRYFGAASAAQAGLIMVAMVMVVFVLAVGLSLSQTSFTSARRTIVTKQSLQTYYVAMAGVQQALANRMYPSSNYLSWNPVGGVTALDPYPSAINPNPVPDPNSGVVYQNPANPTAATRVGAFQYFILGGYQEVDAANSAGDNFAFWPDTRVNGSNIPVKSAMSGFTAGDAGRFLIVSRGMTCRGAGANAVLGAMNLNKLASPGDATFATSRAPWCAPGTSPDVMTMLVVAQVQADDGTPDQVVAIRAYPRDTALPLPIREFVPGAGWLAAGTNINFDPVYGFGGAASPTTPNNPALPSHVVFYNFTNNQIQCSKAFNGVRNIAITPADCQPAQTVNNKSVIKLFFKGPIDHRSVDTTNSFQLTACRANSANCNVKIFQDTDPGPGNTWAPITNYSFIYQPPNINQFIFLPQINALPGVATLHQLQVDTGQIRGWSGAPGGDGIYTVDFTT